MCVLCVHMCSVCAFMCVYTAQPDGQSIACTLPTWPSCLHAHAHTHNVPALVPSCYCCKLLLDLLQEDFPAPVEWCTALLCAATGSLAFV